MAAGIFLLTVHIISQVQIKKGEKLSLDSNLCLKIAILPLHMIINISNKLIMKLLTMFNCIDKYGAIENYDELRVEVARDAALYSSCDIRCDEVVNFIKNFHWFLNFSDGSQRPASLFAFSPSLGGRDPFDFMVKILRKFIPAEEDIPY